MKISGKIKGVLWALAIVAVLSLLVGRWFWKTVSFEEEVLLSDGRKIVVKRWEHLKRSCEGFSCGWGLDRAEIRLPPSMAADSPSWEFPHLLPLMLDIGSRGRPVLLARPFTCGDHIRMNKPIPPYLQFELERSVWRPTSIDRRFHGRESNLLVAPDWDDGELRLVTLAAKTERNNAPGRLMPMSKRINLELTGFC
jgi:hypothetical protein